MEQFRDDCLRSHNTYRKKHGAPPLSEARDLTEHAQKWAETSSSSGRLYHSDFAGDHKFGENLALALSTNGEDLTGEQAANIWYEEISKMNFSRIDFTSGTGNFTQMVWKESREFGVGKARGRDGKVIVVANYRPAGNVLGQYQQNVFPPTD